jgi:hypothetical protein
LRKKPITHKKRAGGVAQSVGPEFKPLYYKNKNKNKKLKYVPMRIELSGASHFKMWW